MKKKSSDAKLNPGYNSPRGSEGTVDRQLTQRVEQASQFFYRVVWRGCASIVLKSRPGVVNDVYLNTTLLPPRYIPLLLTQYTIMCEAVVLYINSV